MQFIEITFEFYVCLKEKALAQGLRRLGGGGSVDDVDKILQDLPGGRHPNAASPEWIARVAYMVSSGSANLRDESGMFGEMKSGRQQVAAVLFVADCSLGKQSEVIRKNVEKGGLMSVLGFAHDGTQMPVAFEHAQTLEYLAGNDEALRDEVEGRRIAICDIWQHSGRLILIQGDPDEGDAGQGSDAGHGQQVEACEGEPAVLLDEVVVNFPYALGDKKGGTLMSAVYKSLGMMYNSGLPPGE